MSGTLLTLALTVLAAGGDPSPGKTREPNPFAPSLPLLTDEEASHLDDIINRFIQYDSGQLAGEDGKRARQDFEKLGPEAIPALIRGLNEAARIEHSCPAVTIAKKLGRMLMVSEDAELLQYARENIGAGITRSRHMAVLRDLSTACMLRQNQVARLAAAAPRGPASTSTADPADVRAKLADDRAEVRAAAARAVGTRFPALGGDLINLLNDKDEGVRQAAHQALVRLNRGTDLGPAEEASETSRAEAVEKWSAWWAQRGGR
jgi:hypothetical protein